MAFQHQEQRCDHSDSTTCSDNPVAIAASIAKNGGASFSDVLVVPATSSTTPSNLVSSPLFDYEAMYKESNRYLTHCEKRRALLRHEDRQRYLAHRKARLAKDREAGSKERNREDAVSSPLSMSSRHELPMREAFTHASEAETINHFSKCKYIDDDIAKDRNNGKDIDAMDEDERNAKFREAQSKERNRQHARLTRQRKKKHLEAKQSKLQDVQAINKSLTQRLEDVRVANILCLLSEPNADADASANHRDTTILSLLEEASEIGGKDIFKKQGSKRKRLGSDASDNAMSGNVNVNTNTNTASITSTACDVHGIPNYKSTGDASFALSGGGHGNSNISDNRNANASFSLTIDGKDFTIGGEGNVDLKTKTWIDEDGLKSKLTDFQMGKIKQERNRVHAQTTRARKKKFIADVEETIKELESNNKRMAAILDEINHDPNPQSSLPAADIPMMPSLKNDNDNHADNDIDNDNDNGVVRNKKPSSLPAAADIPMMSPFKNDNHIDNDNDNDSDNNNGVLCRNNPSVTPCHSPTPTSLIPPFPLVFHDPVSAKFAMPSVNGDASSYGNISSNGKTEIKDEHEPQLLPCHGFHPSAFSIFPDRIPARIEYPQAIFMASVDGSDSDNSNGKTETKREHVPQLPPGHGFHLLTVQNLIPATPKSSTATSVVSVNGNGSSDGRPENTSKREHEPEPQPKKRRVCHGFSSDLC